MALCKLAQLLKDINRPDAVVILERELKKQSAAVPTYMLLNDKISLLFTYFITTTPSPSYSFLCCEFSFFGKKGFTLTKSASSEIFSLTLDTFRFNFLCMILSIYGLLKQMKNQLPILSLFSARLTIKVTQPHGLLPI